MTRPAHRQGPRRKGMAEQRAVDAYELWMEGATYDEIAARMECSKSTAHDRVHRGNALLRGDVADKRDRIAMEHLNDMTALGRIASGDVAEIKDKIAAYSARRGHAERFAKLYGLDEAVKTDITSDGEAVTVVFSQALTPKPQE